jgi:hypothetical protein
MSFLRASLIGSLASLLCAGVAWAGPDLTVEMHGRSDHAGGQTYFPAAPVQFDFRVLNIGDAPAPGAAIAKKGYTIDVVLSQDNAVRPGLARYRASFTDDVLLRGGHFRDTRDLAPGADQAWIGPERLLGSPPRPYTYLGFPLPTGLSPGTYFLCVHVDPDNRVAENNELNNATCMAITIRSYVFPKARKLP